MTRVQYYEKVPAIENNFTVKFRPYQNMDKLLPHWHEHIELLLFLKGRCRFICNGNSFEVRAGDAVIVNSTELHSYYASEKVDLLCILIYPDFFSDIVFPTVQIKNHISGDEYISNCFSQMNDEYTNNREGADMMLKGCAYWLMAYLLRNYTVSHLSQKELTLHNAKLARLNSVLEYISSKYQEKITTKQLAEMAYLNENHFCRLFKKSVGKTVTEYLNEYRVEKATVLLSATDKSITDIANAVGFDDINYFSRIFKKTKNISPTDFRKETNK